MEINFKKLKEETGLEFSNEKELLDYFGNVLEYMSSHSDGDNYQKFTYVREISKFFACVEKGGYMNSIDNREMAINYIEKVLNWEKFCSSHKKLAQSMQILLNEVNKTPEAEKIKSKLKLGMPLDERERSYYLLYIADRKERKKYLKMEKKY